MCTDLQKEAERLRSGLRPSPEPQAGSASSGEVSVRELRHNEEFNACERLQLRIWLDRDVFFVPSLVLNTARRGGGIVLGAYTAEGWLTGFVCSYLGLAEDGRLMHCSQLLAVDPEHRMRGVGFRLKAEQRARVLRQGIGLITWTFDPLLAANARLNLGKLACVSSEYLVNCYGIPKAGLNGGVETDRLVAEWQLGSPAVRRRMEEGESPGVHGVLVNRVEVSEDGLPVNRELDLTRRERSLLLEIPESFNRIKERDPGLARAWRQESRKLFQTYFALGYRSVGFGTVLHRGRERMCHQLTRES